MKKLLLIILFFSGVAFRWWFISLNPLPIKFDQEEYYHMSQSILASGIHTSSYRLYGYPMFIAGIYRVFGNNQDWAWKLAQAVLDSFSGLLIYVIGRKIFKKEMPALLGCILYLSNPYTSAFVGVMLTEVLTIFIVTVVFYLFLSLLERKNIFLSVILSIILGYLPQVRPSFLFLAIIFFLGMIWYRGNKIFVGFLLGLVFSLPFLYNIMVNYKIFGQFSPLTADNLFVREFYLSLFVERDPPENGYKPEAHGLYREYSTPTTVEARKMMAQKYLNWGIAWIAKNPKEFVFTRIRKLWHVWEKPYIFSYTHRPQWLLTSGYWLNVGLLGISLIGLIRFINQKNNRIFIMLYILLLLHITLLHIFSVTDGRFSLPAYPIGFMFAGFAIYKLWISLRKYRQY